MKNNVLKETQRKGPSAQENLQAFPSVNFFIPILIASLMKFKLNISLSYRFEQCLKSHLTYHIQYHAMNCFMMRKMR